MRYPHPKGRPEFGNQGCKHGYLILDQGLLNIEKVLVDGRIRAKIAG
jgi:hypothetical protein